MLRELKIGLMPFSPLGRGFHRRSQTASEYPEGDFRSHSDPRLQDDNFEANIRATEFFRNWREARALRALSLRLPGFYTREVTSCYSPAPNVVNTWKRAAGQK